MTRLEWERAVLYRETGLNRPISDERRQAFADLLQGLRTATDPLGIVSLTNQVFRAQQMVPTADAAQLYHQIGSLGTNIYDELSYPLFFYVTPSRRQFYENPIG
jgi:hypothetical protein